MTVRLYHFSAAILLSAALTSGCTPGAGESSPTGSTGETDTAGTESDTGSETDTESDTGVDPNAPTYFGDVLPIFAAACENCHADGGIAPFVTNRYEEVVPWGPAIAAAVTARTMPPFLVDNSGTCETFEHARWLSDDEVATIEAWVDADMPEGTLVGEAPSPPPPNDLVGEEIVTVSTPAYTPTPKGTSDALYDDYRCFAVEIGNTETKFLQGFEIEPGNAEIVHHVVGFKVDPNRKVIGDITNAGIMELLDGKDDEPGWECFGAAGENVLLEGVPITWAPGVTAINYPEGTGIRFEPGEILVVQMHYYLANSGGEDATGLRLSLADSVDREGYLGIYDEFLFDGLSGGSAELEPGKESVVYAWDAALSSFVGDAGGAEEVEVLGILPHMHRRGQRMQVSYQTESSGEDADCGAYIANWDFDWQQLFFYNEPPVLKPSDRIAVTCEWNTEGAANAIEPGFGSDNEMCLIGVYVAPKKP